MLKISVKDFEMVQDIAESIGADVSLFRFNFYE